MRYFGRDHFNIGIRMVNMLILNNLCGECTLFTLYFVHAIINLQGRRYQANLLLLNNGVFLYT
jgi:hypothetical protein